MERPERYDPEDIEHLMLERSFDELLAEEQAFVLRHLQDRAEYERMRALLLHMQVAGGEEEPLDADPAVREQVLLAFRQQRQPQWRIWLNSVGAFLVPARPVHYWRPALALGTLALLIVTSLSLWNSVHQPEAKVLADLREEPATPQIRNAEPGIAADTAEYMQEAEKADGMTSFQIQQERQANVEEPRGSAEEVFAEAMEQVEVMEVAADHEVAGRAMDAAPPPAVAESATGLSEVVTARAMTKEAADRAPGVMDALAAEAGSIYTEDALLDLLRAAW